MRIAREPIFQARQITRRRSNSSDFAAKTDWGRPPAAGVRKVVVAGPLGPHPPPPDPPSRQKSASRVREAQRNGPLPAAVARRAERAASAFHNYHYCKSSWFLLTMVAYSREPSRCAALGMPAAPRCFYDVFYRVFSRVFDALRSRSFRSDEARLKM